MILAIESAILGGSISLAEGEREVAHWLGSGEVVKGEMLLIEIDRLLAENDVTAERIDTIAVSAGPGSFTGIRTGLATALGLKAGFGINMTSYSALRAMVIARCRVTDGEIVAAVPVGRGTVCFQSFQITDSTVQDVGAPRAETQDRFAAQVESATGTTYLLHGRLLETLGPLLNTIDLGVNLAFAVAVACRNDPEAADPPPLFISRGA